MPLPDDPKLVQLGEDFIAQLQSMFGKHPGFRPAHAKGVMLTGTFTPTPAAATLSTAPHFNNPSTPVTARFSSSTGIPALPDTDANGNPRGLGLRFELGPHQHTDIIAHSTPAFPAKDGAEFLALFRAIAATGPGAPAPSPVEQHLAAHPWALKFVTAPKPSPASFATEAFYALNAFKLVSAGGKETFVRYSILPVAGQAHLDDAATAAMEPNYLYDEVPKRLAETGPFGYKIVAQVAADGDVTDDVTAEWPPEREVVELGTVMLEKVLEGYEKEQMHIIYDPIPRVQGIEPSADPLLEFRAAVYLISGRQRRAAEK
ncbi:catalase-like domain-containing protein [Lineolata rhizophorae]|uniref:Catalase-like domain-containing protein n=1 Tax=Lineolata rhizophorae TaxID=578093 RepID=A0A6A6NVS3_9PEZI|nr:catalase-like domain-containing protein [Lineolata rhizophorae]